MSCPFLGQNENISIADVRAVVAVSLNEEDDLYYFDDFDEEGMTEEEVNSLRNDYENYSEWIDDCIDDLHRYFPKIEDHELNTGAY